MEKGNKRRGLLEVSLRSNQILISLPSYQQTSDCLTPTKIFISEGEVERGWDWGHQGTQTGFFDYHLSFLSSACGTWTTSHPLTRDLTGSSFTKFDRPKSKDLLGGPPLKSVYCEVQ